MTTDAVLSRELKSLQEEISASRRDSQARFADAAATRDETAAPASPADVIQTEQQLHSELRELVNEITEFFAEAEKNIAAHPTAIVIGAMVVGILIGRLLGRR